MVIAEIVLINLFIAVHYFLHDFIPKFADHNIKNLLFQFADVPRNSPLPSRPKFVPGHRKAASLGAK